MAVARHLRPSTAPAVLVLVGTTTIDGDTEISTVPAVSGGEGSWA